MLPKKQPLNSLGDILEYQEKRRISIVKTDDTMPPLLKLKEEAEDKEELIEEETKGKIEQFREKTEQTKNLSPYITREEAVEMTGKPLIFKETADLVGKPKDPSATISPAPELNEYTPEQKQAIRRIKVEDATRAHVLRNQDWYMPAEDSAAMTAIRRTVVDEDAGALERFFNMHYYIDDPVEGKVRLYDYPYFALRFANFFERAASATLALGIQPVRWFTGKVGADKVEKSADTAIKRLLDPTDITITGRKVTEIERKRAAAFAELPTYYRGVERWNEQVTDFGALMASVSLIAGPGVNPGIQSALNKVGATKAVSSSKTLSAFIKSPKLARWATQVPKMGAFGFARTPSEDIGERASAALWLMSYNSTPYVATWLGPHIPYVSKAFEFGKPLQQAGMPVFVTDVILNTMLSTPQYVRIGKEYGWGTPEFWEEVQPILTWDVLMSWGTRKWSYENRDAVRNSYADREATRQYRAHGQETGKSFQEYRDEYRTMFDRMDAIKPEMFPEIEASIILSDSGKVDISLNKDMKLSKTQISKLNKALGVDVKEDLPSRYVYEAEKQGAQMDRSSPNLHTVDQVKEFLDQTNKEIAEITKREPGEMGRDYIKERLNQKVEIIDKTYNELREAVIKSDTQERAPSPDVQEMIIENRNITPRGQRITDIKTPEPNTIKSQHYERVKHLLGYDDSTYFQTRSGQVELEKAIKYVDSKSPEQQKKAMRIAYNLESPPEGYSAQAIRVAVAQSLLSAGRNAEAREIYSIMSREYSDIASELNLAKLDLPGAGELRVTAWVRDQRLEAIGNKLPQDFKGETGVSRAKRLIRTEAKAAAKEITKEQAKIRTAEKLLDLLIC